jgi:cytochrome b6-f complex iron-sulfur subunit
VSPVQPSRRQVLCGLAVALAAPGALAACSSGSSDTAAPPAPGGSGATGSAPPAPSTTAAPEGTPLAQIPVGGGTIITGDDGPVLLVQPTAGTVKAYDAACPHQGTAVDPPVRGVITCPNHFSQFDPATGAVRKGPATRGLTEVPSRVVSGVVQLA